MNKIVGYEKEKNELSVIRGMLHNTAQYRENGVRIPRGLLLIGAPGVGKTMLARSIADEKIRLVELPAATCCEKDAVSAVKAVFKKAKSDSPTVLLLDELDKIAGEAKTYFLSGNDKIRKILLQELDALQPQDEVLVVATCNDEKCLGTELIRPGRFDRQLRIPLPDERTRKEILLSYLDAVKLDKNIDVDLLAKNTCGFSCAKLECLVNDAGILAMQRSSAITEEILHTALNKLEFGANEKSSFANDVSLHRVAVHEAGHALAALFLMPDSLFGASVVPQGDSNGHIRFVAGEKSIRSVSEIETEVAVLLAGHVAERIALGEYMTGSSDDLEFASMRLYCLCTREGAYDYGCVLGGVLRGMNELDSAELKNRVSRLIENKMRELDAMVEELIRERFDVFSSICADLEEKQILTREELFAAKNRQICE